MFGLLKEKQLFGDAFWALFGQLASAIALLAGTRILTELVTPGIYGQVVLLNGFVALGVTLFSYPFICAGMRLLPECLDKRERAALYAVVASMTARATALAMGLLVLGGISYSYFSHSDFGLFMLAGVLLIVTVRRELGIQMLVGERKQRGASLWQTSDSILRPLLAISLVWWGGQKAEWVLLGYIVASVVSNTAWSFILKAAVEHTKIPFALSPSALLRRALSMGGRDFGMRVGSWKPFMLRQAQHERFPSAPTAVFGCTQGAKDDKKKRPGSARYFKADVWAYALPLIPMELIFWVSGLGDRYVIGYLMTAADVGLYAATYLVINEAFNRSAMVLLRLFQPVYFQAFSQNRAKEGFRILWLWIGCVFAIGIIGVSLLLMTRNWVASVVLASSYHAAVELMPAIAIGCALHALGTVLAQPLLANKRTRLLLLGRLCGVVTAAISIPLMVKNYGLIGAAMANPLYFGVELLVLAMLAKPWRHISSVTKDANDQKEDETLKCPEFVSSPL